MAQPDECHGAELGLTFRTVCLTTGWLLDLPAWLAHAPAAAQTGGSSRAVPSHARSSLTHIVIWPHGTVSLNSIGDVGHLSLEETTFSMHEGYEW